MVYRFERKYKDRPDISVLVVEKCINPLLFEQAHHDIRGVAYFLKGYGFTVDLVWSIGNYKFEDFNQFCQSIIAELRAKDGTFKDKKYDDVREIFRKLREKQIKNFENLEKLLRRTPINSVEDLASYDFLVLHLDFRDNEEYSQEILEKYPDKPIILPKGSVVAGVPELYAKDFKIEDVKKDPRYKAVYIVDTNFDVELSILTLMEYILDSREKTLAKPKKS